MKKTHQSILETWGGLFPLVIILTFFLGACAQTAEAPIGERQTYDNPPTQTPGDDPVVPEDGPDEPVELPTDDEEEPVTEIALDQTDFEACMEACKGACDAYFDACEEEGVETAICTAMKTECYTNCSTDAWDAGGCGPVVLNDPKGDPKVRIPAGMKKVSGVLEHCTHAKDALLINHGMMAFVTLKGAPNKVKVGTQGFWGSVHSRAGYRVFAASGEAEAPGTTFGIKNPAKVTLGGKEFDWPYPGASGFPLASKIKDVDLARPMIFVRTAVEEGGDHNSHKAKSARWAHFNDYWGKNSHQDFMIYYRSITWRDDRNFWQGDKWNFTDCGFKTKFDFYFYEKEDPQ